MNFAQQHSQQFDVVIIGSGGAGLTLALSLPPHYKVAVLAKSHLNADVYKRQLLCSIKRIRLNNI